MTFRSGVMGLLLFAAIVTVPPYGFFGGTRTPSGNAGQALVVARTGSAAGSGAGGTASGLGMKRRPVARDCRTCGAGGERPLAL